MTDSPGSASPLVDPSPRPPSGGSRALMDYVRVLYKRRWLAISTFALVLGAGSLYTFGSVPTYEARVQLLIEADNPHIVSFKEVIEQDSQSLEFYQTQYTILRSRSLARKTLASLDLWNHPQFGGGPPQPPASLRGRVRQALSDVVRRTVAMVRPKTGARAEPPAPDETVAQSRAIDIFLNALTVSPVKSSRLVDVKIQMADPALAARVANAFAQSYIEQSLDFRFLASKEASDWLAGQLEEQKKQVERSEMTLQRYREANNATPIGDKENIVVQRLSDLNEAYSQARAARIEKEIVYNELQASVERGTIDSAAAVLANPFIQQLKTQQSELQRQLTESRLQLLDQHPEVLRLQSNLQIVQDKLTAEISKIVLSAQTERTVATAQERSLADALESQKGEVTAMSRKAIEYDALERDARTNRQIFETLLQRAKETGISGELKTSNIRVVDAAEVPRSPIKKRNDFLLALCAAAAVSLGLTFLLEFFDTRIKQPEDIASQLSLPCLGLVPLVAASQRHGDTPLVSQQAPPQFAEAVRALRTNVLLAAEDGPRVLMVTSTGPREGKTMVACNLATVFAQSGVRVLLVDGDLRRPRVHRVFDEPQSPGLTDLLLDATADNVFRPSGIPNLSLLAAGAGCSVPADLLGSPRFKVLLKSIASHFDWVIVDAPPVMAVTDASLIAQAVTGVLFVVGADHTRLPEAQAALEQLASARARFFGAVLNRVDLDRHALFFSRYYRREYAEYYTPSSAA